MSLLPLQPERLDNEGEQKPQLSPALLMTGQLASFVFVGASHHFLFSVKKASNL